MMCSRFVVLLLVSTAVADSIVNQDASKGSPEKDVWVNEGELDNLIDTEELGKVKDVNQREIDSLMMERMDTLEARLDEMEVDHHMKKDIPNAVRIAKDSYENVEKEKRYGGGFSKNCHKHKKISKCRMMPFRGRKFKFCTYKMASKCSSVDKRSLKEVSK